MNSNQQIKHGDIEALWNEYEDFDRQRVSDMTAGVQERQHPLKLMRRNQQVDVVHGPHA